MSDYGACKIDIGGQLKAADLEEFLKICRDEEAGPDWDGGMPDEIKTAENLMALIVAPGEGWLSLMHNQARNNCFDDLARWLRDHKLGYDQFCDGNYDWSDHQEIWRVGMRHPLTVQSNKCYDQFVEVDSVVDALRLLRRGDVFAALAALDNAVGELVKLPKLPPFEVEV